MTDNKPRSIRLDPEDTERADQLGVDVNKESRKAIRTAIHKEAMKLPVKTISFTKKCSCGYECNQVNSLNVSITELGVWFGCPSCKSTGLTGSYKINYNK